MQATTGHAAGHSAGTPGAEPAAGRIAFGPFTLDLSASRLTRDGAELELRPQAFHALRALVRHTGRCVDYEEMIREAWHGVSVSKHTIAVTVGEVKRALADCGPWIGYHPRLGYRLDVPQSADLIRNGWHYWHRHTREGFEKALGRFQRAAQLNSSDSLAWEGISRCWLMLGTFGMQPPEESYSEFLSAHRRAMALGGPGGELRSDRGQGLHVFERRFAEAEAVLLAAEREARPAGVYARLAMLYVTSGRFEDGLEMLARAFAADALWPILPTIEVFTRCAMGDVEGAIACGKSAVDLHPYLSLGRAHYAEALDLGGQFEEALTQYRLACVLSPDLLWLRALEARGLARAGRCREATAILEELEAVRRSEYIDPYHFAVPLGALGRREEAFRELDRAVAENSATLFLLDVDRRLDPLRPDPRFARLRQRLFAGAWKTAPGA